jgi:hypothetical protein
MNYAIPCFFLVFTAIPVIAIVSFLAGQRSAKQTNDDIERGTRLAEAKAAVIAAERELVAARTAQRAMISRLLNEQRRSFDRSDLEQLADEMARAEPPFSAEQRASAWKALAMNPGDPDKLTELRAIIARTTTNHLQVIK